MSLISEALKKAQAHQQAQVTPSSADAHQPRPPTVLSAQLSGAHTQHAPVHHGPQWPVIAALIGGMAALLLLSTGVIVWVLLRSASPETAPEVATTTLTASPAPASPPMQATPGVPEAATEPDTREIVATALPPILFKVDEQAAPPAQPEIISPEPVPPVLSSTSPAPTETAHTAPATPAAAAPAAPETVTPPPAPDPLIAAHIAQLEVRGVMTGGSKILLFDPAESRSRAFSAGDQVNDQMGLVIEDISARTITFVDHAGAIYTKGF